MIGLLGDLGDFVGGLAVVATLIYLAIQVRQNSIQLEKSSTLALLQARDTAFQSFSQFRSHIISSPETADLYFRGLHEPASFSGSERLRFELLVQELFYILHTSFHRISTLSGDHAEESLDELDIASIVRAPGIVQWWNSNKRRFRADFVAVVDGHIAESSPKAP